jgi:hypothetical protein
LEERESRRLVDDVGDDLDEQGGLYGDADPLGRAYHGPLDIVRVQRPQRHHAPLEELAEAGVLQRPVEEIGAQPTWQT